MNKRKERNNQMLTNSIKSRVLYFWNNCRFGLYAHQTQSCFSIPQNQHANCCLSTSLKPWKPKSDRNKSNPNHNTDKLEKKQQPHNRKPRIKSVLKGVKLWHVHLGLKPTIPLLIIQSNFGEELRVEAGLSSLVHKQRVHLRRKATYEFKHQLQRFSTGSFLPWWIASHSFPRTSHDAQESIRSPQPVNPVAKFV